MYENIVQKDMNKFKYTKKERNKQECSFRKDFTPWEIIITLHHEAPCQLQAASSCAPPDAGCELWWTQGAPKIKPLRFNNLT